MDRSHGIRGDVVAEICTLAEKYKLEKVILFGSRARGDYKNTSDIDLAVMGGDVGGFSLAIEEETGTLLAYDIVNLGGSVQEELCASIQREGRILYEKI